MSFYNRCVTSAERKERDTDDVTVQRHPTLHNFVCVAVTLDSACSVARGDYVLPTTRLRFVVKSFADFYSSWTKSLEFTATDYSKRWVDLLNVLNRFPRFSYYFHARNACSILFVYFILFYLFLIRFYFFICFYPNRPIALFFRLSVCVYVILEGAAELR